MADQTEFRGRILTETGRFFLESGGIYVELVPADATAGSALLGLVGTIARVSGVQQAAQVLNARQSSTPESAETQEAATDPALLELLRVAQNPPPTLQTAVGRLG